MENPSLLGMLSKQVGVSPAALSLLLSIFAGYPLSIIHRKFFYGKPAHIQHLYFIVTGLGIGYLNYGTEILHAVFAVVFSYLTMVVFRGNEICVAITFFFNMIYLLIGYYYSSTLNYDINWTMPQCVLVLRLIGTAFDYYDGNQPEGELSATSKKLALTKRPSFGEYCGLMFFPGSFLVGPQFPMRRYQDFVAGKFSSTEGKPPNCINPALKRLGLGVMYLAIFQVVGIFVNDDFILSESFVEMSFIKRYFLIGVWGRIALYKYISCWLITEGACIMFGVTHNGKDEAGNIKWDGLANVDIVRFETATEFNHYIQSFNINTNHWVAQYVYKRLKFLGNRHLSQGSALLFLAIWHGFHSGYYTCFIFEFMVMYMEKDWQGILKKNPHVAAIFQKKPMDTLSYIALRIYTFGFMGWCMIPFALLTFSKYWQAYGAVNYMGIVLFLMWPIVYSPIIKIIAKATRPKETTSQVAREHAE